MHCLSFQRVDDLWCAIRFLGGLAENCGDKGEKIGGSNLTRSRIKSSRHLAKELLNIEMSFTKDLGSNFTRIKSYKDLGLSYKVKDELFYDLGLSFTRFKIESYNIQNQALQDLGISLTRLGIKSYKL
ncbi:hypothetical protein KQX54_013697 [Cotesia glomerata]|uniref:Uncharacterized protein n=1 Tax=Cotesia glomerata TaxID=32391 RepID=A0AAV7I8K8_COTGL|nr:hypothetical protein KQX54_013697 [Cotesia glomerata]